jgi:fructose transport system substrate-binding protein
MQHRLSRPTRVLTGVVLASALVLAACGGTSSSAGSSSSSAAGSSSAESSSAAGSSSAESSSDAGSSSAESSSDAGSSSAESSSDAGSSSAESSSAGGSSASGSEASGSVEKAKGDVTVGLITKTDTNPFFVKMKEGAQKAADAAGVKLVTAAGKFDGDNESQVAAIENMTSSGVKGILLTASDTKAIIPAVKKARDAGIVVIALDTPLEPQDASDALFATDNEKAGKLIGAWAKAKMGSTKAVIATLDLTKGVSVGELRHKGFLEGFGASDSDVVCSGDTPGALDQGQTVMENCLSGHPDINLVYSINEPSGLGGYTAIKAAGKEKEITIVSVDGGCTGVEGVKDGKLAATSQQYPLLMAKDGVEAIVKYANSGTKPTGYTDTGVTLITDQPQSGVESKDTAFGTANCWGK